MMKNYNRLFAIRMHISVFYTDIMYIYAISWLNYCYSTHASLTLVVKLCAKSEA